MGDAAPVGRLRREDWNSETLGAVIRPRSLRSREKREVGVSADQRPGTGAVRDALVLAAGNGDRFKNGSRESKLLQPVLGRPLILRTLETAHRAGITTAHVVLGYRPE